jgi:hypothetical protein
VSETEEAFKGFVREIGGKERAEYGGAGGDKGAARPLDVEIRRRRESACAAPFAHALDADGACGEPVFNEEAGAFHRKDEG